MSQLDKKLEHSATVMGILRSNGRTHELAKIGVDSCVLRSAASIPQGDAELVVNVDDTSRSQRIRVIDANDDGSRTVRFTRTRTRVLFVGASPLDQPQINCGKEYAAIEASKRKGSLADQFELFHCFAATPNKLLEHLTRHQPQILHFGCHGTFVNQLVLENNQQDSHYVHLNALKMVVAAQKDLKLIVFNACVSDRQSASIVDEIDIAIGMNDKILDASAIEFAREFYHRLCCGFDVQNSFESAKAALALLNPGQEFLPEIYCRNGVAPETVEFAQSTNFADRFLSGMTYDEIVKRNQDRRDVLLDWPRTVGHNHWIDRPELKQLQETILNSQDSTTLLLGSKGTGKSALLSELSIQLSDANAIVIAIKAEFLSKSISSLLELGNELFGKECNPVEVIQYLANSRKIVLIVDQLDAIAELMDRESNRLNTLLSFVKALHRSPNVHLVVSCREFEFRHDIRLSTIAANQLFLKLPPWEDVANILGAEGFQVSKVSPVLQELLRNPWHLKIFLGVANSDSSFDSLHNLIQAVWDQVVVSSDGPTGRKELAIELANRISDEEDFLIGSDICSNWPEARDFLLVQDFLISAKNGKAIGFRHQTYYDFVLAKAFVDGSQSLAEHVQEKEQSLFVRPTLLSSLNLLRDVNRQRYREQLRQLFKIDLRAHIRLLLIEYIGDQAMPDEVEADLLLPMLETEKIGKHVLSSVAFSLGWFNQLIVDARFIDWLKKDPEIAAWCIRILQTGIRHDAKRVVTALTQHWFYDPRKDTLSVAVLREVKDWNSATAKIVETIVRRSEISGIGMIVHDIAMKHPEFAPAIVRGALEQKVQKREDESHYGKRIDSLAKSCDFFELDGLAEGVSEKYLAELLPWFDRYVAVNSTHKSRLNHFLRDSVAEFPHDPELPGDEFTMSLCVAAEKLAANSPARFAKLVAKYDSSNMMATHKILMCGLKMLCKSDPSLTWSYLRGDDRRLMVERWPDACGMSTMLIKELFPYLSSSQRLQLEQTLLSYKGYSDEFLNAEPANSRRDFIRFGREYRLRLLNAIPGAYISAQTCGVRDAERLQLKESETERHYWQGGQIGSRMTSEEILKAKPTDFINLVDRLIEHERQQGDRSFDTRFEASRAGGLYELCNAFQQAVSQDPITAERHLTQIDPERHDSLASAAIRGFASSQMKTIDLYQRIEALNDQGFDEVEFREAAANTISSRVSTEYPLPKSLFNRLSTWCLTTPSPSPNDSIEELLDDAIVYHRIGSTMMLTNGRGAIIRAYVHCCAVQEPRRPELLRDLLQELIEIENNPEVLAEVVFYFQDLFSVDEDLATELYDRAIRYCPTVLKYNFCVYAIASLMHLVRPVEKMFEWLNALKDDGSDLALQIFGELLFLLFHRTSDPRCESWIRDELTLGKEAVVHGLAFGAGYFWNDPHCRSLATDVLVLAAQGNDQKTKKIVGYALQYSENDKFIIDQNSKILIDAVVNNRYLLVELINTVSEILEEFVEVLPGFALESTTKLVSEIERNSSSSLVYRNAPESITNIAITLHRRPSTRLDGLKLFERILDLNLVAARTAIDLLDRKPESRINARDHVGRRRRRR